MGSENFNRKKPSDRDFRQLRNPVRGAGQRLRLTAREDGCDGERWATMMDLGEGAEVGERWAMGLPPAPGAACFLRCVSFSRRELRCFFFAAAASLRRAVRAAMMMATNSKKGGGGLPSSIDA